PPAHGVLGFGRVRSEFSARRRRRTGVADPRPVGRGRVHRPVRGVRDRAFGPDVVVRGAAAARVGVGVRPQLPPGVGRRRRVVEAVTNPLPRPLPEAGRGESQVFLPSPLRGGAGGGVLTWPLSPGGAVVISQGRKPLVWSEKIDDSPGGATVTVAPPGLFV